MKAFEVPLKITAEKKLEIPEEMIKNLPINKQLRAIIFVEEPTDSEDMTWQRLTAEQLLAGYAESDAIYDRD